MALGVAVVVCCDGEGHDGWARGWKISRVGEAAVALGEVGGEAGMHAGRQAGR
jgi:hypothetical protein